MKTCVYKLQLFRGWKTIIRKEVLLSCWSWREKLPNNIRKHVWFSFFCQITFFSFSDIDFRTLDYKTFETVPSRRLLLNQLPFDGTQILEDIIFRVISIKKFISKSACLISLKSAWNSESQAPNIAWIPKIALASIIKSSKRRKKQQSSCCSSDFPLWEKWKQLGAAEETNGCDAIEIWDK